MTAEWLTADEIRRAQDVFESAIKWSESYNQDIADNNPTIHGWRSVYGSRFREAVRAAKFGWLLHENVRETVEYSRLAGRYGIELVNLDVPEPVKTVYYAGKFYYLERKGNTWFHRGKLIGEMIKSGRLDLDDIYEGQIPDLSAIKPIVFWNCYDALMENTIPMMEASLISRDMELAREAAECAGTLGDFDFVKPMAWYTRILKFTILEDEDSVRKCLRGLAETRKLAPHHELGEVYAALLDGDRTAAEQRFRVYLEWFRKKRKPPKGRYYDSDRKEWVHQTLIHPDFLLSLSGLAFCNLAASRGMVLDIDEPFLPRQLYI